MKHQKAAAIGGDVHRFRQHGNTTKAMIGKITKCFVMVARNIDDARTLAGLTQQLLDNVVMLLTPIPSLSHTPDIDNITDKV